MEPPHGHEPQFVDVDGDRVRGVRTLGLFSLLLGAAVLLAGLWLLKRAGGGADGAQDAERTGEVEPVSAPD